MKMLSMQLKISLSAVALILVAQQASAAIAFDRTRVVFDGSQHSVSLSITNQNKSLPFLAQSWVEDANGQKIDQPLTALPPVQRVEPGAKGQIKVQATGNIGTLPQDRESLFYFNVREIPPKSNKPNTLQLALQTRVKMFYRPKGLEIQNNKDNDVFKKLTITHQGDGYQVSNPTPYYITIVAASGSVNGESVKDYKPVMVAPKESASLGVSSASLGSQPVLTVINDFGGRPQLIFGCNGSTCAVSSVKAG